MRVLHIHDRWSSLGGADWHLLCLVDALPESVEAIGVFGRSDGTAGHGFEKGPPLPDDRIYMIRKLDKKAPFAAEERVGEELRLLIDRLRPDLIHVHNIVNPYLMSVAAGSAPAVMSIQDHRFFCPGRGKVRADGAVCRRVFGPKCRECFDDHEYYDRLRMLVQERFLALFDFQVLVVLSEYMKGELVRAGLPAKMVRVIPPFVHGLDTSYTPASDGRGALFAGRLVRAKGIFDLLEVLTICPGLRLTLAGAGTMEERIADKVKRYHLKDRITFAGWRPHREMTEVYRAARAVVLPSRWAEPFGIVGLEAQALGRPVAAYDVGGVREWLYGADQGNCIAPGDVSGLARRLQAFMDDPGEADRLGREAREDALARFDRDRLMAELLEVYEDVAAGGR